MEHKNPWENIPQPELVPVAPTQEKDKPSITDIEGALDIFRREEENNSTEEIKKPTIH
ncbi:MAG: hypothetical protein M0P64_02360 [Candidatus Pacebacteria bacterium]|jgi:hypothetical protein|nr:hypothetical protein [Candidatus Paceibacterota bacterium]